MKKWKEIFEGKEPKPAGGYLSYDFKVVYDAINNPSYPGNTGRVGVHIKYVKDILQEFKNDLEEIDMASGSFESLERDVNHAIKKVEEFFAEGDPNITQIDAHIFWSFIESQFNGKPTSSLNRLAGEFEREYKLRLS